MPIINSSSLGLFFLNAKFFSSFFFPFFFEEIQLEASRSGETLRGVIGVYRDKGRNIAEVRTDHFVWHKEKSLQGVFVSDPPQSGTTKLILGRRSPSSKFSPASLAGPHRIQPAQPKSLSLFVVCLFVCLFI